MQTGSLFTSMAGLQAIEARMQGVSSNLANQQTAGYAAVQAMTEAAGYQGANAPPGADAVALSPGPDTRQGALNRTGDPMNVALGGDACLEVQTTSGNALTRDGSLSISNAGLLTDSAGNPILGAGGQPISLPALASMAIGTDGTISGVPASSPNGPPQILGQLALMATPSGTLTPLSGTLYTPPAGAALNPSTDGSVHQGYLNDSNVDPTIAMVEMIDDSRSYQLQTDLIKTQSTNAAGMNAVLANA